MTEADDPGDRGLSPGEVARRLGIPVTTLRTWHRRYGLGPTHHATGHHRRYGPADLDRLEVMRRLTSQGVHAAEAAQAALGGMVPATPLTPSRSDRPSAGVRGLTRAAMRMDAATMIATVSSAVTSDGVVEAWDTLLCPTLIAVGERQAATSRLIEVEHLLSRAILEVLWALPRPAARARVLLACAAEEQHTLPIEALAAALAEHGHSVRMLGARVPAPALIDAVERTGPAGVLVWSQIAETGSTAFLPDLLGVRPRPLVVAVAGPGWSTAAPDGVERPASLSEALDLLLPLA